MLKEYYTSRINTYTNSFNSLKRKENQLSVFRLVLFVASLALFYIFFSISAGLAVGLFAAGLFSLGWLIKYQNGIIKQKIYYQHLITINELELKSLDGDYYSFVDGSEYLDKNHPYSYDLDIFGRASLFQFVNRTISQPAANLLANWLKAPAPITEIHLRQEAIAELKDKTEWRQQLNALGYEYKDAANHPGPVLNWINSPNNFLGKKYLPPLLWFL